MGGFDAFLGRVSPNGTIMWIRQRGTSAIDDALGVAPDDMGGAFVGGITGGSLGGPNMGGMDGWVSRYNGAGTSLWSRQFGGTGAEMVHDLASDGMGGVYIAGSTTSPPGFGGEDAVIFRYDSGGNLLWTNRFGGSLNDAILDLGVEPVSRGPALDVLFAGYTTGSLGVPNLGASDAIFGRASPLGAIHWLKQAGTSAADQAQAIAPYGTGGGYVGGVTFGSLFGPSQGGSDFWGARFNESGEINVSAHLGSAGNESEVSVGVDASGIWLGGTTTGNLFGTNHGGEDWVIAHLTSNLVAERTFQMGGINTDVLADILFPSTETGPSLFAAGFTQGSLGGPNLGSFDAVIAAFSVGDTCYPDCNRDTQLTIADFGCFQTKFVSGDPYADCNGSGSLSIADFGCFQAAFATGCP